jgi:PKD repeat protein
MKKIFYILTFFWTTTLVGQKEVSKWFFSGGLDFMCNPPLSLTASLYKFAPEEGCSSIADSSGNLLFYTDGYQIFDNTHQIMFNGKDIGLDSTCYGSSTQGALIVKQPLQDSIYYIFTTDCAENKLANGFCYSIVNMNLNGGKGAVILKKQKLINKVCEKLAAMRHTNGVDVWVVTHEWGNNKFCSFLLNSAGLNIIPINSFCGKNQLPTDTTDNYPSSPYPECAARGYLKFSPQGNRLVALTTSDCHPFQSYPELFSFNKSNGSITYDYVVNTADSAFFYGGSFSPNGNLLYISSGWYGRYIYQFDLTSNNPATIPTTKHIVYLDSTFTAPYQTHALQIGPNGKIYCATNNNYLHVINNPNVYGVGCNFQLMGQPLGNCFSYSQFGLPNNDESFYLNSFIGSICSASNTANFSISDSCVNTSINFTDLSNLYPFAVNNWKWDFGDPSSGTSNNSNLKNPQHTYFGTGTYQVKLVAYSDNPTSSCKRDSITKSININCIQGINKIYSTNNFVNLFPIPALDLIHIDSKTTITEVKIFSTQGQQVFYTHDKSGIIKINFTLANGLYDVVLTSVVGQTHKKLVVEK